MWKSLWRSSVEPFYVYSLPARDMELQNEHLSVILQSGIYEQWWAESMECHCYLGNVQDLLSELTSPYERRFGDHANTNNLLEFGKSAWRSSIERLYVYSSSAGRPVRRVKRWHLIYFTAVWTRWTVVRRICGMLLFLRDVQDLLSEWTVQYERRFGEQSNTDNLLEFGEKKSLWRSSIERLYVHSSSAGRPVRRVKDGT